MSMRRYGRLPDISTPEDHGLEEPVVKPLKPLEIVVAIALFVFVAAVASYWFFLLAH